MLELQEDFWNTAADYRCITTNGALRANGHAIMGAGIAAQARARYPDTEGVLGRLISPTRQPRPPAPPKPHTQL